MSPLVLHVGLPKTGTTALQHFLFAQHRGIDYFASTANAGQRSAEVQQWLDAFLERVRTIDDVAFNYPKEREDIGRYICDSARTTSSTVLISDEGFTARMGIGIGSRAFRLVKLFPGAHVLLVVRNPFELLRSNYAQGLTNIRKRPFIGSFPSSFDSFVREGLDRPNHPLSPITTILYDKIASHYVELFGRDNVTVLLYEELRNHPELFLQKLSACLSVDSDETARIYKQNSRPINTRPSAADIFYRAKLQDSFPAQARGQTDGAPGLQRGLPGAKI